MAKVNTIYGEKDESELVKKEIIEKAPHGTAYATEYYIGEELVHRSVHFVFNQNVQPQIIQ